MIVSLIALAVLSPIMLIIAIAIKIDSRGPIFFKQKRMGRHGKPFNCYKFRSMKIETPHDMATSVLQNPEQYYTRVGKFLRRFSLDELPQLWCCFWGTMSIIGPRPLVMTEENCNGMRLRLGVYQMRPGLSGYAQVSGRDDVYYKNKAIMDAEYVRNASLGLDIKLIFRTVAVVVNREGNAAEES
ncbi:MAG: sugar transferase [Clostridia bacterium]|nr:sugar transferase [Clostridia bacterium]